MNKEPIKTHKRFRKKADKVTQPLHRCGPKRKVSYRTEKIAEKYRHTTLQFRSDNKLRVYKCPICPHFHLTSQQLKSYGRKYNRQ